MVGWKNCKGINATSKRLTETWTLKQSKTTMSFLRKVRLDRSRVQVKMGHTVKIKMEERDRRKQGRKIKF